jgi:hypothetical protein
MSSPADRLSVAERLAENSSRSSRRSALELVFLPETEEFERCNEGVGERGGAAVAAHRHRRRAESDRQQPRALRPLDQRQQQHRWRVQAAPVNSGICRSASATNMGPCRAKASDTSLLSGGPGIHGSVTSSSSPKPDVACMSPLPRVELEQQRAGPLGRIERVLVQMRQHFRETGRAREQRQNRLAG